MLQDNVMQLSKLLLTDYQRMDTARIWWSYYAVLH